MSSCPKSRLSADPPALPRPLTPVLPAVRESEPERKRKFTGYGQPCVSGLQRRATKPHGRYRFAPLHNCSNRSRYAASHASKVRRGPTPGSPNRTFLFLKTKRFRNKRIAVVRQPVARSTRIVPGKDQRVGTSHRWLRGSAHLRGRGAVHPRGTVRESDRRLRVRARRSTTVCRRRATPIRRQLETADAPPFAGHPPSRVSQTRRRSAGRATLLLAAALQPQPAWRRRKHRFVPSPPAWRPIWPREWKRSDKHRKNRETECPPLVRLTEALTLRQWFATMLCWSASSPV